MKEAFIGALVSAVILVAGYFVVGPALEVPQPPLSGSGQEQSQRAFFRDNMEVGGGVLATTSQGAGTYTASNIINSRVIVHVASAALTATLPTKAALDATGFIRNPGDTYELFIYASTTLITLAGNTGVLLDSASTTNNISAMGAAKLEFVRLPATEDRNIEVHMTAVE